jgi:phage gp36-like protein
MADAVRKDIENIFGIQNVRQWADLDNDGDTILIQTRINNHLADSLDYLYSRLRGRYSGLLPFSNPPRLIKHLNALDAGIRLFDGRLIVANDPPGQDQVGKHRKQYKRQLREILSGQIYLVDGLSGDAINPSGVNYPSAVTSTDVSSLSANLNCTCSCHPCTCHVHTCVNRSIHLPSY